MNKKELIASLENLPDDANIIINSIYEEGKGYIGSNLIKCTVCDDVAYLTPEVISVPYDIDYHCVR